MSGYRIGEVYDAAKSMRYITAYKGNKQVAKFHPNPKSTFSAFRILFSQLIDDERVLGIGEHAISVFNIEENDYKCTQLFNEERETIDTVEYREERNELFVTVKNYNKPTRLIIYNIPDLKIKEEYKLPPAMSPLFLLMDEDEIRVHLVEYEPNAEPDEENPRDKIFTISRKNGKMNVHEFPGPLESICCTPLLNYSISRDLLFRINYDFLSREIEGDADNCFTGKIEVYELNSLKLKNRVPVSIYVNEERAKDAGGRFHLFLKDARVCGDEDYFWLVYVREPSHPEDGFCCKKISLDGKRQSQDFSYPHKNDGNIFFEDDTVVFSYKGKEMSFDLKKRIDFSKKELVDLDSDTPPDQSFLEKISDLEDDITEYPRVELGSLPEQGLDEKTVLQALDDLNKLVKEKEVDDLLVPDSRLSFRFTRKDKFIDEFAFWEEVRKYPSAYTRLYSFLERLVGKIIKHCDSIGDDLWLDEETRALTPAFFALLDLSAEGIPLFMKYLASGVISDHSYDYQNCDTIIHAFEKYPATPATVELMAFMLFSYEQEFDEHTDALQVKIIKSLADKELKKVFDKTLKKFVHEHHDPDFALELVEEINEALHENRELLSKEEPGSEEGADKLIASKIRKGYERA